MTEDEYYLELKKIAEENDLKLSDTAKNIAKFRAKIQLTMDICPCGREKAPLRGCIGTECWKEIKETGHCHCNCFLKK